MNILVIIPARGGSKGIPGKNIKLLGGKPLIGYTIDAARSVVDDAHICVTTDEEEIIEVVESMGFMFRLNVLRNLRLIQLEHTKCCFMHSIFMRKEVRLLMWFCYCRQHPHFVWVNISKRRSNYIQRILTW